MRLPERGARRAIQSCDAIATRLYGSARNPVHQTGTVAVVMLLVLLVTGLYLVVFYRVGSPSASVARLAADPWLGAWMRTLHRYASDVFVIAAALHALRMFGQGRSWGPRAMAWFTGVVLLGVGLMCAWTGFVMAWDTFGERLAREGSRLLDALPVFSEPISRVFAGDRPVPSAFFFVNLFVHLALPLAMAAVLWLHTSRIARPTLLPPKPLLWSIVLALTGASVAFPAALGESADAFQLPPATPTDVTVAWWLPLSERIPVGAAWSVVLAGTLAALLVPRLTRRPREGRMAPSVVDARLCTGCNQCPQDCPWEAISMVAREDDRPALLARVDATRCVSCGICAGACAPMGIGPPGRTGRDQLAAIRFSPVFTAGAAPLVALCCEQAPAAHVAAVQKRGASTLVVSCVGSVHTSVIEILLKSGAAGVMVCGCAPRDCVNREGPKWLHERVFNHREAELQSRVDRRRVRLATFAVGDLTASLAAFDGFAQQLALLNRPRADTDATVGTECESVFVDGAAP
ncbi:MAG: hydrogenase iron-sulfur subunit [Gemmatimonadaceae bacterium]